MTKKQNPPRLMVLIDPDAGTITTAKMTTQDVAKWLSGEPDSEGVYVERHVHDETFEVWVDEDGRSKGLTPWLIHHAPQECTCGECLGAMTFTMLAGRGALSIAIELDHGCIGYPEPTEEMIAEGFTPEFMVGGIVRFINPRMMKRAKEILADGCKSFVITDDESMKDAVRQQKKLDAEVSMLAIACDPVTALSGKKIKRFMELSDRRFVKNLNPKENNETKTGTDVGRN